MRVTHRSQPHDVYIGRPSIFGNPFHAGVHGTKAEVIAQYETWLFNHKDAEPVRQAIRALPADTILACWCAPKPCHGDVIVKFFESKAMTTFDC